MKTRYAFVIIAAVSILIYANSLNNAFQYDDQVYLEENTNIKTIGLPDIFLNPSSLFAPNTTTGHYRPLVLLMHVMNYRIHGLKPWGYHAVNLAFHAGSAMVLFLIIRAMLGDWGEVRRGAAGEELGEKLDVRGKKLEKPSPNILLLTSNFSSGPSSAPLLTSGFYIALTAALIFAVHPFNSEVVNYITARSSVMSGFFYLLAFYCWVKYREGGGRGEKIEDRSKKLEVRGEKVEDRSKKLEVRSETLGEGFSNFSPLTSNFSSSPSPSPSSALPLTSIFYLFSLLAFFLAMLSKESAITLPVILWLYDMYFTPRLKVRGDVQGGRNLTSYLLLLTSDFRLSLGYLPFILAVVVPMMIIRIIYWGGVAPSFKRPLMVQLYTELPVLVKHLRLFIFPVGLNVDHYVEIFRSFFAWPVAVSALILLVYLLLAVAAYRARSSEWRVMSFFMIWFFIVLLPTIVIPLNAIFQENRGYLAVIVFPVFAGVMLNKLMKIPLNPPFSKGEGGKVRNYASVVILIILVLSYGAGTVYRNSVWRNGMTLWSDAVAKSPESSLAHTNLGTGYAQQGRNDKAIEHFLKALRFSDPLARPHLANIHYNLGTTYQQMGMNDMALGEYQRLIELQPQDFRPYYNLGVIYQQKGEMEAAVEAYRAAIARNPSDFRSYHNLGLLFQGRGELSLAEELYRKALSINPDYVKSRVNLEAIYGQNRR